MLVCDPSLQFIPVRLVSLCSLVLVGALTLSESNLLFLSAFMGESPESERVRLAGWRLGVCRVTEKAIFSLGTSDCLREALPPGRHSIEY